MTRHTPGPWKIVPSGVGNPRIVGADGYAVAACRPKYSTPDDYAIAAANAHLIAAAPDLLEALKRLLGFTQGGCADLQLQEQEIYDQARAAIKKATGE